MYVATPRSSVDADASNVHVRPLHVTRADAFGGRGVVVAEMFIGSTDGLGQRVFEAQQLFDMPDMYAAIFAAGALGYGLNFLFLTIERR